MLLPYAMLKSKVYVDVRGLGCCQRSVFEACATAEGQVDVCCVCYSRRPCYHLWSSRGQEGYVDVHKPAAMLESVVPLQLRSVLMSMACVTTEGHLEVHDLCLWPVLPLRTMRMSVVRDTAKGTY